MLQHIAIAKMVNIKGDLLCEAAFSIFFPKDLENGKSGNPGGKRFTGE